MPLTPQSVLRRRRQIMDALRRIGQPVITRHMYNVDDVVSGLAAKCPACYNSDYDQSRADCAVCFGVGFVSALPDPTGTLFISTAGEIVLGDPGTHVQAPLFGGFDAPYLTYVVQPDVKVDVLRRKEQGVLIRTYDAPAVAPWTPTLADNDICINVDLGIDGVTILSTGDRFQLKTVQQITERGYGQRPHYAAGGQTYLLQQSFMMNKIPSNHPFYAVQAEISST